MLDMLTLSPRRRGRLIVVLAAGLAMGVSGCDRDDSASVALQRAEMELRSLMPSRQQMPGEPMVKAYNKVLTDLSVVSQKGSTSQKAAASAMMGQAHAGLAEGPSAQALEIERQTLEAIIKLRAAHSHFLTLSGHAQAAAAFNPAPEQAEIEKQERERQQELVALQQKKADIDAKVQQLLTQAEGLVQQARAKRQESSTIKGTIANETATRGQELMVQARDIGRQADALEVESQTLEAQAAKLRPDSEQATSR
jgi:hypothetical protein